MAERDVAVGEERDDVVHVLERGAAGGDDRRASWSWRSSRSSIQSLRSELAILMMGMPSSTQRSTERSSKGVAVGMQPALRMALTRVAYSLVGEAGVEGLFDVADVGAVDEILVDEVLDVAELELDAGADVVEADDLRELLDDLEAALEAAEVVVRHLQHEQVFKDVFIDQCATPL